MQFQPPRCGNIMKPGLKRKIVLVLVGVLAVVTVLDAVLASYFTKRQNQDAAFATLKRDLLTWQDELQDMTLHMRAVALSAVGETVALNQLAELEGLEFKQADALRNNKEVKEAARALGFSKSVSLNRLHLVLRSGGFSAITVYIDGKLSHQVAVSEVGMLVRRANGGQAWIKAVADGNGNLPIRNWPAWEESPPPPVADSLPPLDRPQVAFTYPSADSMMIEVAVPVEGVIEHSLPKGKGSPSELSVLDSRIAGSVSDPSAFSVNQPSSPFAMVVFRKRIDRIFLQAVERKTGLWPLLFSPDGYYRQQLGPVNLSLQQLLPDVAQAASAVKSQSVVTEQGSFYVAALPWQFERQPGFVLALVASQDSTLQNIRQTVAAILTVASLILALSIGIGIFWVGRFIDPIIALTNAVKAVGLGSAGQVEYLLTTESLRPLSIQAPGEVGDLAWAFDLMIAELKKSFDTLEQRVQARTVELLSLQQVLEKQNRRLEKQSLELSAGNRLLQEEIVERQSAEELLRLREQEFRSLAENSPDNIARYDRECRIKYMNSELRATVGIADGPVEAYIGNTPNEIFPDGRFGAYQETIKGVAESGLEAEIELMLPDSGDGIRYHLVRMVAERDQDGEVMGVLIMGRDITERKRMEAELKSQADFQQTILNAITDAGIQLMMVEEGRIIHVGNRALAYEFGFTDEDIDAHPAIADIIHPDDLARVTGYLVHRMAGEAAPSSYELGLVTRNGERREFETSVAIVPDSYPVRIITVGKDITERKRMEETLANREQELRALAESSPGMMGCFHLRPDGSVYMPYVSANIRALFGLRPEDVADNAEPLLALNHPGDAQRVLDSIAESARTMSTWHLEYRILHPDRGERWMEGHTSPEPHPGGGIVWYGYVHDITERKHAEIEKRRLINILEQSADFIGSADMQGNLTYHNRAALRMVGLPEDADLSAMHFSDMHPAWAVKLMQETAMPSVLADGAWRGETALLHRDGREIPVSQLVMLHRDTDGQPEFMATIMQDITARKQAEDEILALNAGLERRVLERTEELRRQTRYLRTMIDTLPMMVWFKDTDSRFLVVNQALARVCAHGVDDLVGKSTLDCWPRDYAESYLADDAEVMATGQGKVLEELFVDERDAVIWVETFRTPVVDEDGRILGTVGVSRDISERKAVEAAREAALAEAERLAQLRSKFMARMSHELRTPLNGILGYAQILLGESKLNERQDGMVSVIQQSGEHLLNLINDILDFAKIEAGKQELSLSDVDLPRFLSNIASIVSVKAEQKQLVFVCDIATDVPVGIRVDELRIKQVLLNLLANAVKYTERGWVKLRVGLLEKSCPEGAHVESGRLRFEIQDSGVGIEAGQLERIFQPFEQAGDRRYSGGTGLGLVISRELARLMGSDIFVASRIGEGSRFWFDLDVPVVEACGEIRPVGQHAGGYRGPRRRVLVVDDIDINRALLIDMLGGLGFETVEAANGKDCLDNAARQAPDLVLLDMVMPEMDGLEAARRLRCLPGFGQTPIIAVSAGASDIDIANAMEVGVNAFLSKPAEIKKLMGQIAGLLKLDWVYAQPEAEPGPQYKPDEWLDAPPMEEMRILLQLAEEGSMRDIIIQADYLRGLDPRYRPFAEQLRGLAKGYQSKAVLELVERYIDRRRNYSTTD